MIHFVHSYLIPPSAVNVEVQVITGTVTEGINTVFTLQAMTDVPVLESAIISKEIAH